MNVHKSCIQGFNIGRSKLTSDVQFYQKNVMWKGFHMWTGGSAYLFRGEDPSTNRYGESVSRKSVRKLPKSLKLPVSTCLHRICFRGHKVSSNDIRSCLMSAYVIRWPDVICNEVTLNVTIFEKWHQKC